LIEGLNRWGGIEQKPFILAKNFEGKELQRCVEKNFKEARRE